MTDKYLPVLGKTIGPECYVQRDAIHVAVFPAIAKEDMLPGDHVALSGLQSATDSGNTFYWVRQPDAAHPAIGVVDPFLKGIIGPGTTLWVMLFPNTITYLVHVWEHPAFDDVPFAKKSKKPKKMLGPTILPAYKEEQEKAKTWLMDYASELGLSLAELMNCVEGWLKNGSYFSMGDQQLEVHDEFWGQYETYTGKTVDPGQKHNFFSCSC